MGRTDESMGIGTIIFGLAKGHIGGETVFNRLEVLATIISAIVSSIYTGV
jgi:ABC-type uncharacterized transport system permease subunit